MCRIPPRGARPGIPPRLARPNSGKTQSQNNTADAFGIGRDELLLTRAPQGARESVGSVQRILERLAGLERRDLGRLDLDVLAGARVAARAGGTLADHEGAEADQRHVVTLLQRLLDDLRGGVERAARIGLGEIGVVGDGVDQFCFVHGDSLNWMASGPRNVRLVRFNGAHPSTPASGPHRDALRSPRCAMSFARIAAGPLYQWLSSRAIKAGRGFQGFGRSHPGAIIRLHGPCPMCMHTHGSPRKKSSRQQARASACCRNVASGRKRSQFPKRASGWRLRTLPPRTHGAPRRSTQCGRAGAFSSPSCAPSRDTSVLASAPLPSRVCAGSSGRSSARSSTWSIQRTGWIFSAPVMFFGMSARSFSFSSGMITVVMPPRCAASSFSLRPPIGNTRPRRVISPVIATSERTGTFVNADTSAVHIAMPALGPSLGVAPSGTCTWMSYLLWKSGSMPSRSLRARTTDCAAWMDSFITSPSCPVRISLPLPGTTVASMLSRSPPTWVQARPVTRPTSFCSSARPKLCRRTPRYLSRLPESTLMVFLGFAAFAAATACLTSPLSKASFACLRAALRSSASVSSLTTLRQILASSRSRLRTPDSRV